MKYIIEQFKLIKKLDPAIKSNLEILLYPSFKIQIYYRLSNFLYRHKLYFLARKISEKGKRKTGIEIHPGATIGHNLFIDHGFGIVIGETTIIGNNVEIFHGVTLGGTTFNKEKRHPTIEDNVLIGCNATILGNITIGANSKVGAKSLVLKSMPANATIVGIPGKVIKLNGKRL